MPNVLINTFIVNIFLFIATIISGEAKYEGVRGRGGEKIIENVKCKIKRMEIRVRRERGRGGEWESGRWGEIEGLRDCEEKNNPELEAMGTKLKLGEEVKKLKIIDER